MEYLINSKQVTATTVVLESAALALVGAALLALSGDTRDEYRRAVI
ncbi:MAG: hypothetical protein PF487_01590 [Bacteroidales bacterium]|jgi:hypothetical protein|nr:hypothetical protein [Bacteroidales bacterium]